MALETAMVAVSLVVIALSLSTTTAAMTTVALFLAGTIISPMSNLSTAIALLLGISHLSKRCLVSAVVIIGYLL